MQTTEAKRWENPIFRLLFITQAKEIPPPQAELKKLYEAAMLGMMSQIRKQMDNIEQLDSQYAPFADKVRKFARLFEEEKIVALVEGYLESTDLL